MKKIVLILILMISNAYANVMKNTDYITTGVVLPFKAYPIYSQTDGFLNVVNGNNENYPFLEGEVLFYIDSIDLKLEIEETKYSIDNDELSVIQAEVQSNLLLKGRPKLGNYVDNLAHKGLLVDLAKKRKIKSQNVLKYLIDKQNRNTYRAPFSGFIKEQNGYDGLFFEKGDEIAKITSLEHIKLTIPKDSEAIAIFNSKIENGEEVKGLLHYSEGAIAVNIMSINKRHDDLANQNYEVLLHTETKGFSRKHLNALSEMSGLPAKLSIFN